MRLAARVAGAVLLLGGVLCIAWVAIVWRWGDPLTSLYNRSQQQALRKDYAQQAETLEARFVLRPPKRTSDAASRSSLAAVLQGLDRNATIYRSGLGVGDPVGVLTVPRLGLRAIVVEGTDDQTLKRGPGRDQRTYVPGEGELVYVAGHRTTYGAPFARIDALRVGDRIGFDTPYGRFSYAVTGHRIVSANAIDVLRSGGREHLALQACHPRFFATQRYIADARLVRIEVLDGDGSWQAYQVSAERSLKSPVQD